MKVFIIIIKVIAKNNTVDNISLIELTEFLEMIIYKLLSVRRLVFKSY